MLPRDLLFQFELLGKPAANCFFFVLCEANITPNHASYAMLIQGPRWGIEMYAVMLYSKRRFKFIDSYMYVTVGLRICEYANEQMSPVPLLIRPSVHRHLYPPLQTYGCTREWTNESHAYGCVDTYTFGCFCLCLIVAGSA